MNCKKRGQITLFIIAGIVILIVIALLMLVMRSSSEDSGGDVEEGFSAIDKFISTCIKTSAAESGFYISEHAGYPYVPSTYITYGDRKVTKVFDYGLSPKSRLLSWEQFETNYATKTRSEILKCVDEFKSFENQGFVFDYDSPMVEVKIFDERTDVKVKFRVKVKRGKSEKKFYEFPVEQVPLRIGYHYKIAEMIVAEAVANPRMIPVSRIDAMVVGKDIRYQVPSEDRKLFYYFIDESPQVLDYSERYYDNQDYKFIIGEKFG